MSRFPWKQAKPTCRPSYEKAATARMWRRASAVRLHQPEAPSGILHTTRQDLAGARPVVGRRFGSFIARRLIGEGTFGVVYQGEHHRTAALAAIKVSRPRSDEHEGDWCSPGREARLHSLVRSDRVPIVFDAGTTPDGLEYLVMELVEGTSLEQRLEQGLLPRERALDYAIQIAHAIRSIHHAGIIHCDIKPANVLIRPTDDGRDVLKVTDFSIAEEAWSAPERVQRGANRVCGTPRTMAPEQWIGDVVDGAVDIYALGITLFECLTGAPPFDGDTTELLAHKHLYQAAPALEGASIPAELSDLVARMLHKFPASRPTPEEVIAALTRIRDRLPCETPADRSNGEDAEGDEPDRSRLVRGRLPVGALAAWLVFLAVCAFGLLCRATARPLTPAAAKDPTPRPESWEPPPNIGKAAVRAR